MAVFVHSICVCNSFSCKPVDSLLSLRFRERINTTLLDINLLLHLHCTAGSSIYIWRQNRKVLTFHVARCKIARPLLLVQCVECLFCLSFFWQKREEHKPKVFYCDFVSGVQSLHQLSGSVVYWLLFAKPESFPSTLSRGSWQDSLRYLVQNSLKSFTQMIHDACYQVLDCPEDMVWSNSLLVSEYKPKRNPIFVIDLMLGRLNIFHTWLSFSARCCWYHLAAYNYSVFCLSFFVHWLPLTWHLSVLPHLYIIANTALSLAFLNCVMFRGGYCIREGGCVVPFSFRDALVPPAAFEIFCGFVYVLCSWI